MLERRGGRAEDRRRWTSGQGREGPCGHLCLPPLSRLPEGPGPSSPGSRQGRLDPIRSESAGSEQVGPSRRPLCKVMVFALLSFSKSAPSEKAFPCRTLGRWGVERDPQGLCGPEALSLQQVPMPAQGCSSRAMPGQAEVLPGVVGLLRELWVVGRGPWRHSGLPGSGPVGGPGVTWMEGTASQSRGARPGPLAPRPAGSLRAGTAGG